jgi:hypothetical protein
MKAEAPRRHGLDEKEVQVWRVGFSSGGNKKAGKGMLMAEGCFESRDSKLSHRSASMQKHLSLQLYSHCFSGLCYIYRCRVLLRRHTNWPRSISALTRSTRHELKQSKLGCQRCKKHRSVSRCWPKQMTENERKAL